MTAHQVDDGRLDSHLNWGLWLIARLWTISTQGAVRFHMGHASCTLLNPGNFLQHKNVYSLSSFEFVFTHGVASCKHDEGMKPVFLELNCADMCF